LLGAVVLAVGVGLAIPRLIRRAEAPIVVGLVHSRSGPLQGVEQPMLDAEILALEEINAAGGLLGRRVEWVVGDGRSDPSTFGQEARRLVESERASILFGGLTAACRRAMEAAAAPAKRLVMFPGHYEGMEVSLNVIGTGPTPNQQAVPAVSWCLDALKARKFFLAGAADVSSYAIHAVVRDQLKAVGATLAGEAYAELDGGGMEALVASAKASGADVVISSVVGEANREFFRRMAAAGLTAEELPVVCLRVSEDDLRGLPADETAGHYAAWAYFQSLGDESNRRFVERFKARYGGDRTTSDPVASAYYAVKLWAQAVDEAESDDTDEVRESLSRQSLEAGEGIVAIDRDMLHVWRPFKVGRIRRDGQIDLVWKLSRAVRPASHPVFRPRAEWQALLQGWRATGKPGPDGTAAPGPAAPPATSASTPPAPEPPPVVWGPRGAVRPGDPSPTPPEARSARARRSAVPR